MTWTPLSIQRSVPEWPFCIGQPLITPCVSLCLSRIGLQLYSRPMQSIARLRLSRYHLRSTPQPLLLGRHLTSSLKKSFLVRQSIKAGFLDTAYGYVLTCFSIISRTLFTLSNFSDYFFLPQ